MRAPHRQTLQWSFSRTRIVTFRLFFAFIIAFVFIGYAVCLSSYMTASIQALEVLQGTPGAKLSLQEHHGMQYEDWRALAITLAKLPADQVLKELETRDPFGTRTFEKTLLQEESHKGSSLDMSQVADLFPCPVDRITLPDQRDQNKARDFLANTPGTFLFYQHLRKAGGTSFCTLAKQNLPKSAVARHYCMSDFEWSLQINRKGGAGRLKQWPNREIVKRMIKSGHRVTGNEWDNFDRKQHFELPAIFATSFRRPMDRALSQFRFECIEERGCKIKDPGEWWKKHTDLYNVYTRTFADDMRRKGLLESFNGNTIKNQERRAQMIGDALDTVAKFHLVLSMEWLTYAKPQVERVLGFKDTSALTKRVRPHIGQHSREDGQEINTMGAAGIAKASWSPKDYLTAEQFKDISEHLALDEILTDAARRMFLERMVCDDMT